MTAPNAASVTPSELVFRVHGTPAPQGSKRHVGRGILVESSAKVKPWREAVKHAALDAAGDAPRFTGAVTVEVTFYFDRPKGHFRTGRNAHLVRDTAPVWPAGKPDLDKLLRSTFDAIGEAGVWRDDAQVVSVIAHKEFCRTDTPTAGVPGARIRVWGER